MIGKTLGHYRIESQLGAGGMGVVYRAHDEKLERTVAIKVVGERLASEPNARERLLREARTASALNHPHICTVHEVGEADGLVFIVMEHVAGRSLSALLSEPRPMEMVVRYGIQIADALAHAHERGVVHRDLKTGNVMLTPEGRIKVLDFGLAKRLPTEDIDQSPTRTEGSLTEDGQVVGTLHYIAPEILRGQAADARADIWALGVLLYELAMGDLPFQGRTRFEVTHAILGEAPTALSEKIPAGLRAVILRCLAKEPGQRYQRASEVRAALEAIESGSSAPAIAPEPPASRRWRIWSAGLVAVVLLLAWFGWARFFVKPSIESVAVLPFVNVGADPEQEYLSDGIAESVIASLSQIASLRVIAFGSVARYKGHDLDAGKIGRELKVAAVVMGKVEQHGNMLVIRADLVDAADGRELWGQKFSRKASDLLSVQDDISSEIVSNLRQSLTGEERKRVARHPTENSEAYQLYLKGNFYHLKQNTLEDYNKALDYYQQAIQKDPAFALAYSGLADLYTSMAFVGAIPPKEASEKARAAIHRAQEIDETLPAVHLSRAVLAWGFDWDWSTAENECQRAFELNPNDSGAHFFCGQCSRALGRFDEAISRMKRAEEVDPLSAEMGRSLGDTYYWAGRYDQAITQFRKVLELAPQDSQTHDHLADVYARKGMHKESIAERQQAFALQGDKESADGLGQDFERLGFERVMQQQNQTILDDAKERSRTAYVSPFEFALAYARLGDKDQAFTWLNKAFEERSPWLTYIKTDPASEPLRSDPRFADLLRRIGLPRDP